MAQGAWRRWLTLLLVVMLAILAASLLRSAAKPEARRALGLFTTLPVMWEEADGIAAQLGPERKPPWVRVALERRFALKPLDTLLDLGDLRLLLLAQPRPLDPAENVALDGWVRQGGRLLLFADPMLTAPSRFPLGDRRRPQDVVLLSPILAHWGLDLTFDEDQPPGLREVAGSGLRADLPGRLARRPDGRCRIEHQGLVAACTLGRGRVLVVADAALLDASDSSPWRAVALESLLDEAFGPAAG